MRPETRGAIALVVGLGVAGLFLPNCGGSTPMPDCSGTTMGEIGIARTEGNQLPDTAINDLYEATRQKVYDVIGPKQLRRTVQMSPIETLTYEVQNGGDDGEASALFVSCDVKRLDGGHNTETYHIGSNGTLLATSNRVTGDNHSYYVDRPFGGSKPNPTSAELEAFARRFNQLLDRAPALTS